MRVFYRPSTHTIYVKNNYSFYELDELERVYVKKLRQLDDIENLPALKDYQSAQPVDIVEFRDELIEYPPSLFRHTVRSRMDKEYTRYLIYNFNDSVNKYKI